MRQNARRDRISPPTGRCGNSPYQELFDASLRAVLNELRQSALRCRSSARSDLFEACAVLLVARRQNRNAAIDTLMRCLAQALGRAPVLFRPGEQEMSFDEAWLLRAISAAGRGEEDNLRFLIHSRISPTYRRNTGFLIGVISGKSQ